MANAFQRRNKEKDNLSLEGYSVNSFKRAPTKTDRLINILHSKWNGGSNPLKSSNVRVFSLESDDIVTRQDTDLALSELEQDAMNAIAEDGGEYNEVQRESALMGAAASNEREIVLRKQEQDANQNVPNSVDLTAINSEQATGRRSLEAYDNSDNRNSMILSFTYNLKAARQDDFGEAFFPTVAISPDTTNVQIVADLLGVFNDMKHATDGTFEYAWGTKSLINALVYPDILDNDSNINYPVYRDNDATNVSQFVDKALVKPRTIVVPGTNISIKTAPLQTGKEINLLGLSQTDQILERGHMDFTDQLDRHIALKDIYIKMPNNEVFAFRNLNQNPDATFVYSLTGNSRDVNLNYKNAFITLNGSSTQHDGKASALQAVTGNYTVNLSVFISGTANLNFGTISVFGNVIGVSKIYNTNGEEVPLDKGVGKTIADEINGAQIIGYEVDSRRINLNHRERGQLLDVYQERLIYTVRTLAPISIVSPTSESDTSDGARLDSLIHATNVRCSVAAVKALLASKDLLSTIPKIHEPELLYSNKTLGVARYSITPYYEEIDLDVLKELNTLSSAGRISDVSSVFINTIRDMVFRAFLKSNYGSFLSFVLGETGEKPTVIIGTDPVIAGYLQIQGDLRNLGDEYQHHVVTTNNILMRDKIIMVFGRGGRGAQDLSNPGHFGNMLWRPEIVSTLPITRNGQTSKELTVQPQFLHVTHCPIMMCINVSNISEAVQKQVPINAKVTGTLKTLP